MQKLFKFRTKEELKDYLLLNGLDASDEAVDNLKKNYEKNLQNTKVLTKQQMANVAGGAKVYFLLKDKKYF